MTSPFHAAALVFVSFCATAGELLGQGNLTPPGVPAPTMKTLTQLDAKLEPRTAVNATNTPGDASGVFAITQPGSYYLSDNISGVSGKNGITIESSGVTLDLNGFDLAGTPGSLSGVSTTGDLTNVSVFNGSVRNWPGLAVDLSASRTSRIDRISASGNLGSAAIVGGRSATISHCMATSNLVGITCDMGSLIVDCTADANTSTGIVVQTGSTAINCAARNNQDGGFSGGANATWINCSAQNNQSGGIFASFGSSKISNCTVSGNSGVGISASSGTSVSECHVDNNTAEGITAGDGCTIRACHVRSNAFNGILAGSNGQIVDNLCDGNGTGAGTQSNILITGNSTRVEGNSVAGGDRGIATVGGGNLIVRNSVRGGTSPYAGIAGGNDVGPIGSAATSTSPWANILY